MKNSLSYDSPDGARDRAPLPADGQGDEERSLTRELLHDLRDPLNAISMNAELARLQVETAAEPEKTLLCLDRILEECERCAKMLAAGDGKNQDGKNQS